MDLWPLVIDDLISLIPCEDKLRDLLDRMLTICIYRDHSISSSMFESCGDRELLSEVPRKPYTSYMLIRFTELLDLLPCTIRRSIIDEDDLIVILVMERLEYRKELTIDIGDIALFTIGRDDDREKLMGHEKRRKD